MKIPKNILKQVCILSLSFFVIPFNVYANEKFKVDGEDLHYNTELAVEEINRQITEEDVEVLLEKLKNNPNIKRIILTSWGGLISSAVEMADIIIDFELDTHVSQICFSACPILLIAGETRTLERGSKIGFHRSWWDSESMRIYYEEQRESYGWGNEFDFSSWVYDDSQQEIYSQFKYYLERGVSPSFVIETMKARSDDGWFPRRKDLLRANVITK
tara:strand:+ start:554 stop:1201 length:648 start_codon:yes stop_codon:yes gene_type:complete